MAHGDGRDGPGRIQKLDRARCPGRSTCAGGARLEKMRAVRVIKPLRPGTGRGPFVFFRPAHALWPAIMNCPTGWKEGMKLPTLPRE